MSIESKLFDALKALVSNKVFPDVAPLGTVSQYITYQQAGGDVVTYAENAASNMRNGRFQISVWASTRSAASALMRQTEIALIQSPELAAEPLGGPVSRYDTETQQYGAFQYFSIWFE